MNNGKDLKWKVLVAADEARRHGYVHTYHALLEVLQALRDTSDQTLLPLNVPQRVRLSEVIH